ncbi:MAG TPA: hypothetical protein VFQ72_02895 [Candidatus Paceibacterota bacterium]|nr:hypothetical protein [Candidatus Paceibacterota bacterium]
MNTAKPRSIEALEKHLKKLADLEDKVSGQLHGHDAETDRQIEAIQSARKRSKKTLEEARDAIKAAWNLTAELHAREEVAAEKAERAEFAAAWPVPKLEKGNLKLLLALPSWSAFPRISDPALTGRQRKEIRKLYGLIQICKCENLAEFVEKSPEEIKKLRGIGDKAFCLAESLLKQQGLRFGMRFPSEVLPTPALKAALPSIEDFLAGYDKETVQAICTCVWNSGWPYSSGGADELRFCTRDWLSRNGLSADWITSIEARLKKLGLGLVPS